MGRVAELGFKTLVGWPMGSCIGRRTLRGLWVRRKDTSWPAFAERPWQLQLSALSQRADAGSPRRAWGDLDSPLRGEQDTPHAMEK